MEKNLKQEKKGTVITNRVLNTRQGIEYLEKIAEKYDIVEINNVEGGEVIEVILRK